MPHLARSFVCHSSLRHLCRCDNHQQSNLLRRELVWKWENLTSQLFSHTRPRVLVYPFEYVKSHQFSPFFFFLPPSGRSIPTDKSSVLSPVSCNLSYLLSSWHSLTLRLVRIKDPDLTLSHLTWSLINFVSLFICRFL